jgi:hypothetical protein
MAVVDEMELHSWAAGSHFRAPLRFPLGSPPKRRCLALSGGDRPAVDKAEEVRFATDSLPEEDGFEPPVPLGSNTSVSTGFARVEEACSEKPPVLGGDRQFESVFLQRTKCSFGRECALLAISAQQLDAPTVREGSRVALRAG